MLHLLIKLTAVLLKTVSHQNWQSLYFEYFWIVSFNIMLFRIPFGLISTCCGLFALLLIASAIILSLIPLYLPNKNVDPLTTNSYTYNSPIQSNNIINSGTFNSQQRSILQNNVSITIQ